VKVEIRLSFVHREGKSAAKESRVWYSLCEEEKPYDAEEKGERSTGWQI
jgi:hypothetical protein